MDSERDNPPQSTPPEGSGDAKLAAPKTPPAIGPQAEAARPVVVLRYPKPPAFPQRLLRMCIRPEEWAEAARYPLWRTLLLALLAIVLGAVILGAGEVRRDLAAVRTFAVSYDKTYPPLRIDSAGILSVPQPLKEPLTIPIGGGGSSSSIVVDPSGQATFESIKTDAAMLITDKTIGTRFGATVWQTTIQRAFPGELPAKGQTLIIDSKWLTELVDAWGWVFGLAALILIMLFKIISNGLWVLLMMFFCAPLIMLAARGGAGPGGGLVIPKRVAYRIGAAVTIPLVIFEGLSQGFGYSVGGLVGPQNALLFWIFAAAALALWAGYLARTIFAPPVQRRRAG